MAQTIREIVKELEKTMQCVCDLDRWQPERDTGHSWVCPIHKAAINMPRGTLAQAWEKRIVAGTAPDSQPAA